MYVDMDGVLADFVGGAIDLFNLDAKREDVKDWEVATELGVATTVFWSRIRSNKWFWANLNKLAWADEIIKIANNNHLVILTSALSKDAEEGKQNWVDRYYPGTKLLFSRTKYEFAREGRILIDDKPKNIDNWILHGGIGILFPAPWNKNKCIENIPEYIKEQIDG